MDALVEPYQFSQQFFSAYKNARNIVDYSGRGQRLLPVTPLASPV